jgi:sugar/nucleoside kinase (ribokinase family)
MAHVVCVGDLMVDVLAQLPGPLAVGSDTPAPVAFLGGGAAANVACWLASAGTSATFVGRVGADVAGREAIARLEESGVTPAVSVDPELPTGSCIVLVGPDGERTMVPSNGANSGLGSMRAATSLPGDADALYVSGYALLDAGARPFAIDAITHGRERGWLIIVDAASAAPLAAAGADAFDRWVGAPGVVFANDDEARVLTGATGADAARTLAPRFGEAVVKSGRAGSSWSDGSEVVHAPAPAAEVVDTTGAGDAFAAGFLSGRLRGGAPSDWLRRGAELAARAVQTVGARPQLRP